MDYGKIAAAPTSDAKIQETDDQLRDAKFVSITDALANYSRGGNLVFEALAEEQKRVLVGGVPRMWRIEMICDMWGKPYHPGDVVKWESKGPIRLRGKKLNNQQIKDMIRRGEKDKLYFTHSYIVDEDGCISCSFEDACYLLRSFGVHYSSNVALSSKREKSRSVTKGADGSDKQRHNWRCKEVVPGYEPTKPIEEPKEEPAEAPKVAPKKRGRKPAIKKTETTEN